MRDATPNPPVPSASPPPTSPPVSWREARRTWAYIGLNSFGGPAGQIAVMHKVLVEEKRWISEARFLHALNYCMLLPGPEAMQLATYIGWLMHGTRGGLLAGTLFVLPGVLAIGGLSIAYTTWGNVGFVQAMLFGLKAAVLAIVVEAIVRIGKRVLKNPAMVAVALAAFIAIFMFEVPFPLIILGAAMIGLIGGRLSPSTFATSAIHRSNADDKAAYITDRLVLDRPPPTLARSLAVLALWLPLWLGPVLALRLWLGAGNVFAGLALFFSKVAVITFGGAYAVLAYVAQQAVENFHWLEPGEMLTGLGLAETTPGPLIMVVQFVGYLAAFRDAGAHGGAINPMLAGVLASLLVCWVTFVPCFMWIFLGAPYVERARRRPALNAALTCITAAVVGVIANLALWFALHTLFNEVGETTVAGLVIPVPKFSSVNWPAVAIALVAAAAMFVFTWGPMRTLALAVALGLLWHWGAAIR